VEQHRFDSFAITLAAEREGTTRPGGTRRLLLGGLAAGSLSGVLNLLGQEAAAAKSAKRRRGAVGSEGKKKKKKKGDGDKQPQPASVAPAPAAAPASTDDPAPAVPPPPPAPAVPPPPPRASTWVGTIWYDYEWVANQSDCSTLSKTYHTQFHLQLDGTTNVDCEFAEEHRWTCGSSCQKTVTEVLDGSYVTGWRWSKPLVNFDAASGGYMLRIPDILPKLSVRYDDYFPCDATTPSGSEMDLRPVMSTGSGSNSMVLFTPGLSLGTPSSARLAWIIHERER
jgi:hypothetical protein